jgi:hypothetical protein
MSRISAQEEPRLDPKFSKLDEKEFSRSAVDIIQTAKDSGISLRILGAMAAYIHTSHDAPVLHRYVGLKRLGEGHPMFTDLDLMGYSKQRKEVGKLFEKTMGFVPNFYVNSLFGGRRNIFHHPKGLFDIDIFYDVLSFSHEIKFGENPKDGRLELDFPTISLADIVLEKLQIHQINRKDLIDLFVLFSSHEIAEGPRPEFIDGGYIARTLSSDWGFEYDAMSNLEKLKTLLDGLVSTSEITEDERKKADQRANQLVAIVNRAPKSKDWEKRSKKGTSKPWFNEVEEVER